jgi:beta-lactamase regulating signal transducer with metallopeptidase domain
MNAFIATLNRFGGNALHFAWPMLWQSSVLIAVLFVADFALRRHVRAAVRYALWLVLLVKLLLPPSLALPTSAAWWLFPSAASRKPQTTRFVVHYGADTTPSLPLQPTPAFIPPPQSPMSAAAWTILAWSAISAGLLVWLMARWRQVVCDVKRATPVPAWLSKLFVEAKDSSGLRRNVRLRLTDQAMSPAVCGLFRPVILLPQSLVQKLPLAQLRAVLLHELTHLRRGDVWMNCAQALIQIGYWWHPLLWLANARIRRVREEAVDDAVMLTLRDDAETYAPTLLEVAKLAFNRPLASLGWVGILESRSALRQRIERLVNFRAPRKAGLTLVSLCGICIFSATALPMGEAPPPSSDASKIAPPAFSGTTNKPASSADASTNLVHTGAGREVIYSKLDRIRLDTVSWPEGLPLSEVLRNLSDQTRLRDPDKKGINFLFNPNAAPASAPATPAGGAQTIDPATGLPVAPAAAAGESVDASSINVKLKLSDVRLAEVLDAIVLVADHPIKYTVLDNGIVFSTRNGPEIPPLETRAYKVDQNVFLASLQKQTGLQTNASVAMKQLLSNIGMELSPPKSIFYSYGKGVLFVRATEQDLDTVGKAIQVLDYTPPPQIHIKARFIEVPEAMAKRLESNFIPTGVTNVIGVLTDPNLQLVLHALEQSMGTETLAEPEVTTTSGRQTQMRATEIITIRTNCVFQETSTNSAITPQTEKVECGPVLDMVASVLPDGYTIDLRIIASLTEFLGYDKPPTNSTPVVTSTGAIVDVPNILPSFNVRQANTHLQVWDGQTVVLGGLISTQIQTIKDTEPVSGSSAAEEPPFREQTIRTFQKRQLLILITATIVDPAGNRVHNDNEMLFAHTGIPPQHSP